MTYLLQTAGLPVPPMVTIVVQGLGLLLDTLAPNCPVGPTVTAARIVGSAHAHVLHTLHARGIPLAPLPASWQTRFGHASQGVY